MNEFQTSIEFQAPIKEKAILVGLNCPTFRAEETASESTLAELEALVETAGGEAVASVLQNRPAPDARTLIGEGKCEEIRDLADAHGADLIIFDNELSPSQMNNLERLTGHTVLDRSKSEAKRS